MPDQVNQNHKITLKTNLSEIKEKSGRGRERKN